MPLFYEGSLGAKLVEKWNDFWSTGGSADDGLIEDREALAAAEDEAAHVDPLAERPDVAEWATVYGPLKLSDLSSFAGLTALNVTAPLDAAGIPSRWAPYPPSEMPSFRVELGVIDRPFTLLVPQDRRSEAHELLHRAPLPAVPAVGDDLGSAAVNGNRFWAAAWHNRRTLFLVVFAVWFGIPAILSLLYPLYHFLRYGHL
jgi:hypothetical protein